MKLCRVMTNRASVFAVSNHIWGDDSAGRSYISTNFYSWDFQRDFWMKQLKKVWPRRALFYTPASDLRKIQKLTKLSGNGVPDFVALGRKKFPEKLRKDTENWKIQLELWNHL